MMEKNKGRPKKANHNDCLSEPRPTLKELGVDQNQSTRWQAIASVPEKSFEELIATAKEEKVELTSALMLKQASVAG